MPDRDAEIARRLKAAIIPDSGAPRGDGVQRRFALLVGIDRYEDAGLALPYCVSDVKALEVTLSSRGYDVTVLTDARATRAAVIAAIQKVVERADGDDLVIVHFSGHGQIVGDRPYLLLHDTPRGDKAIVKKGLRLTEALAALHRGPSRWTAVFLDACHMGLGLDPETAASTPRFDDAPGGFALLAGSTEGQITQDSDEMRSGVFTAALLEGLRGAAAGASGGVQFSALAHHVQARVAEWRRSAEGQAKLAVQTPVVRMEVSDVPLLPGLPLVELDPGHVHPLYTLFSGGSSSIRASAFSPDGRWLVTGSEDDSVGVWDAGTGKLRGERLKHDAELIGVAFLYGEPVFASLASGGALRFWRLDDGAPLGPAAVIDDAAIAIASSPAGPSFAVAAVSDLLVYKDRLQKEPVWRFGGEGILFNGVAFSPDGKRIATCGEEYFIRLWDAETGAKVRKIRIGGPVASVAFSVDGKRIATVGGDLDEAPRLRNAPSVWDAATGKRVFATVGHTRVGRAAAFSPDGKWLATASLDGTVRIWSAADGRPAIVLGVKDECHTVTFSPDSQRLFAGLASGRGLIYRISDSPAPPARKGPRPRRGAAP